MSLTGFGKLEAAWMHIDGTKDGEKLTGGGVDSTCLFRLER
jgi:hypothetical protein